MQHGNRQWASSQIDSMSQLLQSIPDSTVLEAVSAGRQLPLLLVSLLKAFASLHEVPSGAANSQSDSNVLSISISIMQRGAMGCVRTVSSKLADCLTAASSGTGTASSSSSNHSQRQLLAVLLARCLVVVGRQLLAQMVQTTALLAAPVQEQCKALACCWKALQGGDAIIDALVEELPSLAAALPVQLPSAALQQLADERVQPFKAAISDLKQGVPVPVAAIAGAGGVATVTREWLLSPAPARAAQQLEAFGAAVAGLLPLPDCCNYHACSSASRASEGELVSGNSCVCGGCGVARYCSRECQVAHYKGWHKAVCKRLQQQQQQP